MPRIQYGFLNPANVPITVPAAGVAPGACAGGGGAPGTAAYPVAINAGNPQQNLPHLRLLAGAAAPAFDALGYYEYTGHEWNAAIVQASTAYPPNFGLGGAWAARNFDLRRGIIYACRSLDNVMGISHTAGTPIIDYIPPPGGVALLSRLETNERIGLSYFMGVLMQFLTALQAGFSFILHTKLLDLAAVPLAPGGGGFGQGSQYLAGNKPDFISYSPIFPVPAGPALPGNIHILEAKGRMQNAGVTVVGARAILGPALDQCFRYQHFRIPVGGIPAPAGIGGWGPGGVFFAAPAANVMVFPTSRVSTLGVWDRVADRWQVWATDPAEESSGAPAEFSDGYLRLYYAQFKPYFDQASTAEKSTVTYRNIQFETVDLTGSGLRIGIDKRILDLLRNEPKNGYAVGHLTRQITTWMPQYTNEKNELEAYVTREGIYSANLRPVTGSNPSRVNPAAGG